MGGLQVVESLGFGHSSSKLVSDAERILCVHRNRAQERYGRGLDRGKHVTL